MLFGDSRFCTAQKGPAGEKAAVLVLSTRKRPSPSLSHFTSCRHLSLFPGFGLWSGLAWPRLLPLLAPWAPAPTGLRSQYCPAHILGLHTSTPVEHPHYVKGVGEKDAKAAMLRPPQETLKEPPTGTRASPPPPPNSSHSQNAAGFRRRLLEERPGVDVPFPAVRPTEARPGPPPSCLTLPALSSTKGSGNPVNSRGLP